MSISSFYLENILNNRNILFCPENCINFFQEDNIFCYIAIFCNKKSHDIVLLS